MPGVTRPRQPGRPAVQEWTRPEQALSSHSRRAAPKGIYVSYNRLSKRRKAMTLPGFTGETSLYKTTGYYKLTTMWSKGSETRFLPRNPVLGVGRGVVIVYPMAILRCLAPDTGSAWFRTAIHADNHAGMFRRRLLRPLSAATLRLLISACGYPIIMIAQVIVSTIPAVSSCIAASTPSWHIGISMETILVARSGSQRRRGFRLGM